MWTEITEITEILICINHTWIAFVFVFFAQIGSLRKEKNTWEIIVILIWIGFCCGIIFCNWAIVKDKFIDISNCGKSYTCATICISSSTTNQVYYRLYYIRHICIFITTQKYIHHNLHSLRNENLQLKHITEEEYWAYPTKYRQWLKWFLDNHFNVINLVCSHRIAPPSKHPINFSSMVRHD